MIKVKNLWKAYGKQAVLKGLNLELADGETLVILGRSGVGKSVLLRQIIGIEQPDEGYVEVNGVNISFLSPSDRYKNVERMGMLFQGAALFDSMNVGENVQFYLKQHKTLKLEELKEKTAHALKIVGLEGIEDKMPSDLSGGMRKRVALARVIIYDPKIILYDEPTTGLDPITSMQINELIIQTQKELRPTSIVVTHDIRSAMEIGDKIAFHHDGVLRYLAPKQEFMQIQDPLLQSFFENAILTKGYYGKNRSHL